MPGDARDRIRPARIELKVQRAPSKLAQPLVIELAHDVARKIAYHETHDLVVDAVWNRLHRGDDQRIHLVRGLPFADIAGRSMNTRKESSGWNVCVPVSRSCSMMPFPFSPDFSSSSRSAQVFVLV